MGSAQAVNKGRRPSVGQAAGAAARIPPQLMAWALGILFLCFPSWMKRFVLMLSFNVDCTFCPYWVAPARHATGHRHLHLCAPCLAM